VFRGGKKRVGVFYLGDVVTDNYLKKERRCTDANQDKKGICGGSWPLMTCDRKLWGRGEKHHNKTEGGEEILPSCRGGTKKATCEGG